MLELYRGANVALECMEYNLERELAFTTRTIEYLWCGLPVIYNNYAEISDHISEYNAGWCIDPTSDSQIEAALAEIFERPDLVAQKSENARKLVADRFSWDKTIEPLVQFLNNPVRQPVATPAYGAVLSRATYLSPRGTTVEMPLIPGGPTLEQHMTIPAEHITSLEISISLASADARSAVESVTAEVRSANGRVLANRKFQAGELPLAGKIELEFPWFRRPKGGDAVKLRLSAQAPAGEITKGQTPLYVRGLVQANYPFTVAGTGGAPALPAGKSLLGDSVPVAALHICFVPGTDSLYRLKVLRERALWMLRERQYRRLWLAGKKRLPSVIRKVKAVAGM